jgi:LmbE family N-acetylglucosaminyl deacetylase
MLLVKQSTTALQTSSTLSVVISPHIDDAILSAGGWLLSMPGYKVVVNVFAGIPSAGMRTHRDALSGCSSSRAAMQLRHLEEKEIMSKLGVEFINLKFLDGQYRQQPHSANMTAIIESIQELLRDLKAQHPGHNCLIVLAPSPLSTTHSDHTIASHAVMQIAEHSSWIHLLFYSDFPYTRTAMHVHQNVAELTTDIQQHVQCKVQRIQVPLSPAVITAKKQLIGMYKSQARPFLERGVNITEWGSEYAKWMCGVHAPCEVYHTYKCK